ncbi:TPA: P-II family nitrogen regulator [Candidatus Woesearchaeota archaeon]|nr:P-II family nitrogen regulator [Candidatus Woesearchaeota archaeon]HII69543.1 P-II family nitrogen regulator [Candidatus Woesearchaeota archaeon]
MKAILAVIRPEKFRDVKDGLHNEGVHMMTVLDVRGCGQQKGYTKEYRGVIEEVKLHRKVMLLIAVNKSFVEKAIKTIVRSARTGKIGDGKIFVLPLEDCIRISSGETGVGAIGGSSDELRKLKQMAIIEI